MSFLIIVMIVKNIYQPKNITKRVSKNDLKEYFVRDMGDSQAAAEKLSSRILEDSDLREQHMNLKDKEEVLGDKQKQIENAVRFYERKINDLEKDLNNLKEERKKEESKNDVNTKEIKIYPYLEFFKSISKELKEREEKKLLDELEKDANLNYKNSLKHRGDEEEGGILHLNKQTGIIQNQIEIDGNLEVRHQGNKSNLILMKLAIIESLIKFYSSNLGKKYPFIGDNFQASMDEETELAHLNQLQETFYQVIVIAEKNKRLLKLKYQKNVSVSVLKWKPRIEDKGVTTITKL